MDIAHIRRQISALDGYAYLNVAGAGPAPQVVQDEVMAWMEWHNQNLGRPGLPDRTHAMLHQARSSMARLLGCTADEVALTHNATEGILLTAWGRHWEAGDEVIITDQEHPANVVPWHNLAQRYGIRVRMVRIETETDPLLVIQPLLNDRTRMISISHISRETGRIMPIKRIARLARAHGVRLLVDGAQSLGAIPVDVVDLGCDYYVWCGHKRLLGPAGTGGIYFHPQALEDTLPSWVGWNAQAQWNGKNHAFLRRAKRFESGTHNYAVYAGLIRAIDWLEEVGLDAIWERNAMLDQLLVARLQQKPALCLKRPASEASGVVGFSSGDNNHKLCLWLREQERLVICPVGQAGIRVSVHFFNTQEEIEHLSLAIDRALDENAGVQYG